MTAERVPQAPAASDGPDAAEPSEPSDGSAPRAAALAIALTAEGVHCDVEARGTLAILRPNGVAPALADPAARRRATSLAAAHGFTHLALDLSHLENDAR